MTCVRASSCTSAKLEIKVIVAFFLAGYEYDVVDSLAARSLDIRVAQRYRTQKVVHTYYQILFANVLVSWPQRCPW